MKINKSIFIAVFALPMMMLAQEQKDTIVPSKVKLERAAFESTTLIENQSNVLWNKGTLEFVMNHRFGLVNGDNNMIGIWDPANIRIGLNYSVCDRVTIGYGTSKDSRLQDFSLKGAILRQTRGGEMPVSVSYYGNFAISALPTSDFLHSTDRYSYFNQLIIAKRFNRSVSFQVAPSLSHYNYVEAPMKNDLFAVAVGGRVKITDSASLLVDYTQPITNQVNAPKPGLSLGVEFSTGSHAFQLFITNYRGIVPQQSIMMNQNDFFKGDFAIGFNITRLWHL
ncbi:MULTISPECIES: DUF5777 family beta-barrel protein [unclassified Flavobacterium]|jgi:hypothetical protein|uniref:DUF5777 family beta-barrel protein n=1 Tax=unclassified Flavobacterium TaxID=196869 RepID=UPI0025BC88F8|nr:MULTISPECIES: DUF5777 family beta-barrel protein [unclassified Flavobacterium]